MFVVRNPAADRPRRLATKVRRTVADLRPVLNRSATLDCVHSA